MSIKKILIALVIWSGLINSAHAELDRTVSITGVQGYDLVSYHVEKRPLKGNGHFTTEYKGITYQFVNKANKSLFDSNPEKYLPAYGGYCAFGVSVNKKFLGDPEVWRLVDGKLYLNLDANVQDDWFKDVPGHIKNANNNWEKIKSIPANQL
jgi:YHS domain-containing protein